MSTEIKFEGLEEFQLKLKTVIEKYPNETEKELKKLGKNLKKMSQDKTPKKTGKLRKSYKLSNAQYDKNGSSFITFTNTSPLFHLIERGHKIVTNRGSNNANAGTRMKSGKEIGFVPGKHMVENSVTELDNGMKAELDKWMDNLLEGVK